MTEVHALSVGGIFCGFLQTVVCIPTFIAMCTQRALHFPAPSLQARLLDMEGIFQNVTYTSKIGKEVLVMSPHVVFIVTLGMHFLYSLLL